MGDRTPQLRERVEEIIEQAKLCGAIEERTWTEDGAHLSTREYEAKLARLVESFIATFGEG